jgi:hypothetical protein
MRTLMKLKGTLLSVLSLLLLATVPLQAQVPSASSPPFQPSTFTASASFAAPQTGAGDLFCVYGSATRLVKIKAIRVSGVKTTAEAPLFHVIKRSTAATGGTSTAPTATPLDTTQTLTAATATVAAYTAIPTAGTGVGNIGSRRLPLAAASGSALDFLWVPPNLYSDVRLRGVAQGVCLNAPAAFTTDGPTLAVEVTWTEQ